MKTTKHKVSCIRQFSIAVLFAFASLGRAQTVLIPYTGSLSVPCGSNVLLQDHAGTGSYNANADGYVVLMSGGSAAINIAGTYTTEAGYDYIRIYNGVGTGGALLATYNGQNLSMNYQGAAGQTLTVRFQSDGSVQYAGFDLNVTYSGACNTVACSGAPGSNTVVGPGVLICPNIGPNTLTLSNSYVTGGSSPATAVAITGLTYSWFTGTTSLVGPFPNPVPTATNNNYSAPGVSVTTFYQAIITCTNGGVFSTTATAGAVNIAGTTTSVVPYYEGFEGIGINNKLPNCSWSSPSLGSTVLTYTNSGSNNRVPMVGTSFAAFAAPASNAVMYTNGIQMEPGITYSAAIHYASDYIGSSNWTNLSILVGPNQSATGQVLVASTSPAISGPYKRLDNTFTVPSSGLYYLAIQATGTGGTAPYLMIDQISVTIPCDNIPGNTPTVAAVSTNSIYCSNDNITANASGADTYTWSTGENTSISTPTALAIGLNTLYVSGSNTLSGCVSTASIVLNIIPAPPLSLFANNPEVCIGQPANISAFGNGSIVWSTTGMGPFITVSPSVNTTYSATITGSNGCATTESIAIAVKALPAINITGGLPDMCAGELLTLSGSGGVSYQWNYNVNVSQSSILNDNPHTSTIYTLTGLGSNGCSNKSTYSQNVSACVGLSEITGTSGFRVYPNPSSGLFTVETGSSEELSINVTDLSGRIVRQMSVTGAATVDISELSSGVYYVQITGAESTQNLKLIKQ